MGSANVDSSKINQWQKLSWHNIRSKWSDNFTHPFRFDFEGMASNTIAYIDDAMLIDLTAAFGAGNEPTQEWCDTNIEYFAGNKTIQYEAPNKYDLTVTIPTKIQTGDILNCPYSGSMKSVILPKGTYVLECWGAQGGNGTGNTSYPGGKGGYSKGTITLDKKTNLYLYTGGQGLGGTTYNSSGATTVGGFNGGGSATSQNSRGSGGGGTDIRIGTDSLYARVLVAGGGSGSSGYVSVAGFAGGGISGKAYGNTDSTTGTSYYGGGGSQTEGGAIAPYNGNYATAGSFGQGGNYTSGSSTYYGSGGGGGWYGGGGAVGIGGGGSGYIYTSSTASNYPSGCLLDSSYYLIDAQTIAGNAAFTSPTGTSETGHTGNGYIRITVIKANSGNTLVKIPQTLPSTYSSIKYLQFTGTQYIDTGAIVDSNTGFDITFEVLNGQSGDPYYNLFGVRGNDSSGGTGETQNFFRIDTIPVDSNSGTEFKYGSTVYNSGIKDTSKINIKLLNKVYTKPDGSTITVAGTITSGLSMYIGCINKAGTAYGNISSMKLYRFKIYNGSTLAHDFIPAQRVSDKALGLYDLKTSTFKTNMASGVFTSNLMNDPSSLVYFNGDSLQSQGNLSLTITKNNVTLSNEQTHFGKNSLKFDGSSSYMYMPFPSTYTGDITLEGWFYQTSNNNTSYPTPFTLISSKGRGMYMHRLSSQTFVAATPSNSWPGLTGGTTALNTWTHIAMCLSGTTTYCFLDGKLKGTLTNTNTSYVGLTLGTLAESASNNHASGCYYKGYIAELKITKGCKWTKDFTLPTASYGTAKDSNPWKEPIQMFVNTGSSTTISSGLVELEYIEATGTQYLDTGIIVNKNDNKELIMSCQLGNDGSYAGANGYMQYQASITGGAKGILKISYKNNIEKTYFNDALKLTKDWTSAYSGTNVKLGIFKLGEINNTWYNSSAWQIGKLYYYKLYDNDTLVRDFIPAKRISDGKCGLWDKVNFKFYTDESGGNFTAGTEKTAVAAIGTPIEYLEATGTQYINTKIPANTVSKVITDFQFTSITSGTESEIMAVYVDDSNRMQCGYHSGADFSQSYTGATTTYSQLNSLTARTTGTSTPLGSPSLTIYLFGQNQGNTLHHPSKAKIYSCKMYKNGKVAYDFIPVKITTNTYGLWDNVNKIFYSNAGTGAFTGGSTVTLTGWHKIKGVWAKTAVDTWNQIL